MGDGPVPRRQLDERRTGRAAPRGVAGRQEEGARSCAVEAQGAGAPPKGEAAGDHARALKAQADAVKGSRHALAKGRENLSDAQRRKIGELKRAGSRLFRAWELKEGLRTVFMAENANEAKALPDDWTWRAGHCGIEAVVAVEKKGQEKA